MRKFRKAMSRKASKKLFRNTAKKVHKKNLSTVLHRGGYML